jgi:hydroxyacylglutathione hydrolase
MAPAIADVVEAELRNGTLEVHKGSLKNVDAFPAGACLTIRVHDNDKSFFAARVINCTGPAMNYRRVSSRLLQNLFKRGLVAVGTLGCGFRCAEDGAVIDAESRASQIMFNLGPGRLGDLLESIAVPEIRQQAVELASLLAGRIRPQRLSPEEMRELTEEWAAV